MKKAIQLIIKEVGINGLIAIKNNRLKCGHSTGFYHCIKNLTRRGNNDFAVHSLIWGNLTHLKDFAQYQ